MAGILVKISSLYGSLPDAERSVADYVLKHADTVPYQSVNELSEAAMVSVASVSRLARKVGCANFKDFKIEIAQDTSTPISNLQQGITSKDSDEEIVHKVFQGNIKSLEDTLKILDISDLSLAAKTMGSANRVVFFGVGGSGNVVQDAAMRFSFIDIQSEAYTESYQMLVQASRLKKNDVAVGISHSGRANITLECLKLAQMQNACTIGVSNYPRSPLSKHSQIFLCTSFPENRVKVASISSYVAQTCLIDVLYLLVARHKRSLWNTEKLDTLTERFLRIPEK